MAVRWSHGERKIPLSGNVETDRLLLTRPRLSEVPEFYGFLGDPWAMQFTQIDKDLASCRKRIAVHEWRRRRDGFAPWTFRVKGEPEIIGWGGLYDDPFDPGWGPELAFFFHPKVWGQGYGVELSLAALEVADIKIELPLVSAFAHLENVASQKLLQKVGFQPERHVESMNRILYRRRRPAR
ncbi:MULTISPECIES: GNAT family N-acetyltransferase [unclassified Roseibium]|uniref:GNAT family N-acetyltransferase n=1 Tax=unclassified Roseibium TaxID=2629323 RepID=UPI00273D7EB5|nr:MULTISPECIES: GNAT family N-acetyltransferase [unclassified Roseibium]